MSCHDMSCHVMSCHVMSCHVTSRHVTSRHVMSCHVMPCHVMSCHVTSRHVTSCHVMSRHVKSCYVMDGAPRVRSYTRYGSKYSMWISRSMLGFSLFHCFKLTSLFQIVSSCFEFTTTKNATNRGKKIEMLTRIMCYSTGKMTSKVNVVSRIILTKKNVIFLFYKKKVLCFFLNTT